MNHIARAVERTRLKTRNRVSQSPVSDRRSAVGDPADSPRPLLLHLLCEKTPGSGWAEHFHRLWPAYRDWLDGRRTDVSPLAPASLAASRARLRLAMPELAPVYERLVEIARKRGGTEEAERFLTLYRPPAYLTGCSILARSGSSDTGGEPVLVRNYDYDPLLWESAVMGTAWCGQWVLAVSDCLWGALDGMNGAGLAVALAFGGRRTVGDGFGIPLVVRYLLESCSTVEECRSALERVPSHMAYNVTALDRNGEVLTAYLEPGRRPRFSPQPYSANHQEEVTWREHAEATRTVERAERLAQLAAATESADPSAPFLEAPLHARSHERGFATLYTSIYRPLRGTLELVWRDRRLELPVGRFVSRVLAVGADEGEKLETAAGRS